MKAILVINVPDDFLADPSDAYRLQIGGDAKVYYVRQGEKRGSIIGDTRDIKPMPDRKEEGYPNDDYTIGKSDGWNACLKEIENESTEKVYNDDLYEDWMFFDKGETE